MTEVNGNLTFSTALVLLKEGKRLQRAGWNGKGMWVVLVTSALAYGPGESIGLPHLTPLLPWVGMYTADHKFVPWLCSQTDMLAEDWQVVPHAGS